MQIHDVLSISFYKLKAAGFDPQLPDLTSTAIIGYRTISATHPTKQLLKIADFLPNNLDIEQ
jgi:hypothetical protein